MTQVDKNIELYGESKPPVPIEEEPTHILIQRMDIWSGNFRHATGLLLNSIAVIESCRDELQSRGELPEGYSNTQLILPGSPDFDLSKLI